MPARPNSRKPASDPLASVFDALPIGLYVVDRDLNVVSWNRLREQGPLGRPRSRVVGRPLRDVLGKGFAATEPVLRQVLRTGRPHEEVVETGGSLYHVRRLPVRRGSQTSHVVSWFEDIGARRQRELQLVAEDRVAFLGQLVSGVAHEISNPLAGIAGCAEALASIASRGSAGEARREARQFRDLIRTEVQRCERIVKFLLDSTRPSGAERADVRDTLTLALRLLERHPALSRVKVRARLAPDLPRVRIDADALKQVVMALVMNAALAMPDGGLLEVSAARRGGLVHLDLADSGNALAEPQRARVFEPFAPEGTQRGASLGLAVARGLLRNRGGDLLYRPRKDGNVFRVVLRVATGTR